MSALPYKTTVSVAAASRDLTTLATVKTELGITDTTLDAWLSAQITQASQAAATYCNRVFAKETLLDYFRLDCGAEKLLLSRQPVASITSVVEDGATLTAADYEFEAATGFLWRLDGSDNRSWWAAAKIVATHISGYELLATLPTDIEKACIVMVKQAYFAKTRDPMVKGESIEIPGVETRRTDLWVGSVPGDNGAIPQEAEGLLGPYRIIPI